MKAKHLLDDITFTENEPIDVSQLNSLYQLIGWDSSGRCTDIETEEMLRVSHYHIAAHTINGLLIGFARVCGDPYIVQVLDVITHPDFRHRGIATRCMQGVLAHLQRSNYVSVTLTDGSGIDGFYQRFGFQLFNQEEPVRVWKRGTETFCEEIEMEEEKGAHIQ
jgi:ribosomal protein S18 acetylase RimI-like enzyme